MKTRIVFDWITVFQARCQVVYDYLVIFKLAITMIRYAIVVEYHQFLDESEGATHSAASFRPRFSTSFR
jgi:hypothetical protein